MCHKKAGVESVNTWITRTIHNVLTQGRTPTPWQITPYCLPKAVHTWRESPYLLHIRLMHELFRRRSRDIRNHKLFGEFGHLQPCSRQHIHDRQRPSILWLSHTEGSPSDGRQWIVGAWEGTSFTWTVGRKKVYRPLTSSWSCLLLLMQRSKGVLLYQNFVSRQNKKWNIFVNRNQ